MEIGNNKGIDGTFNSALYTLDTLDTRTLSEKTYIDDKIFENKYKTYVKHGKFIYYLSIFTEM